MSDLNDISSVVNPGVVGDKEVLLDEEGLVTEVAAESDSFEDFGGVFTQANPEIVQSKRRKRKVSAEGGSEKKKSVEGGSGKKKVKRKKLGMLVI
jgi:hypothetical protein